MAASMVLMAGGAWVYSTRPKVLSDSFVVSADEVRKHNTLDDCWVAIHGKVYDLTEFLHNHPGGAARILRFAGKDATPGFHQIHLSDVIIQNLEESKCLGDLHGVLETIELEETETKATRRLVEVEDDDEWTLPPLGHMLSLKDFETVAQHVLPPSTFTYYLTGASDENTLAANFRAYTHIFFRPRVLRDVSHVDILTEMLGCKCDAPIYITAFAGLRFAHPLGEINLSHGAYAQGIVEMIPTQCLYPLEEFLGHSQPDQNQWYQMHFYGELMSPKNLAVFDKVNAAANIKGICINVDLAALGNRERDERLRLKNDPTGSLQSLTSASDVRPVLTWDSIDHFRKLTNKPIMLKGVQSADDVVLAAEHNLQGVILLNHGGRQLDYSPPPLRVLAEAKPLLKEKGLDKKFEIYIDGGIRRGSDIIKALCLGATGVGLGRPFLFAMSAYGQEGVERVVQILKDEMVRDMKLIGARLVSELNELYLDLSEFKK